MADGDRAPVVAVLLAVAALTGCRSEPPPAEKAASDARAIAQVEAIQRQKPPPRPIYPQAIGFADIQAHRLYGAGCAFSPVDGAGPVMLAQNKAGYVRLANRLIRLASDSGSTALPLGAWTRYTGRRFAVRLGKADGDGQAQGSETMRWPGELTITDSFDQVIYQASGVIACGT